MNVMLLAHRGTKIGIYMTSEYTGEITPDGGLILE